MIEELYVATCSKLAVIKQRLCLQPKTNAWPPHKTTLPFQRAVCWSLNKYNEIILSFQSYARKRDNKIVSAWTLDPINVKTKEKDIFL